MIAKKNEGRAGRGGGQSYLTLSRKYICFDIRGAKADSRDGCCVSDGLSKSTTGWEVSQMLFLLINADFYEMI